VQSNNHQQSGSLSPILGTGSSPHNISIHHETSFNTDDGGPRYSHEFGWQCYLIDLENNYSFDKSNSISTAIPSQYLRTTDLHPVICVPAFLYIVYRDALDVTFFKVRACRAISSL
jgi:hypothetical protein